MGLFDGGMLGGGGVAGLAEELGKPQDSANSESYRKPMSVEDFDTFGADLVQGEEVVIAEWEAPAGIARRFGYGVATAEANQGYAYGKFQNANGETIHGGVVLKWQNSTGRGTQVVEEVDSKDINTNNRYNRDEQVPIPEDTSKKRAEQDESLLVVFEANTDPGSITNSYAIDAGNSDVRLPTTEYDLSSRTR